MTPQQRYKLRHRDKVLAAARERSRKLRQEDPEKTRAYQRQRYAVNSEKMAEQARLRRASVPKETRSQQGKARYQKNADTRRAYVRDQRAELRGKEPWRLALPGVRCRAKTRNIPFDLTPEWARSVWTGRCALTGIEFDLSTQPGRTGPRFYSPSIDRIEPALGYTQGNCRFVLFAVNALKSDACDADMLRVARALLVPEKEETA